MAPHRPRPVSGRAPRPDPLPGATTPPPAPARLATTPKSHPPQLGAGSWAPPSRPRPPRASTPPPLRHPPSASPALPALRCPAWPCVRPAAVLGRRSRVPPPTFGVRGGPWHARPNTGRMTSPDVQKVLGRAAVSAAG